MKRYISALLLIIFAACFISCEKDIEFKGKVTKPLLVLNGMLTPDSVVSIHLSQSRFILGDVLPFTHIAGATVSVYVNGQLKEQITNDVKGTYKGIYTPKPGDEIKIEVKADGFDVLKSQTVIPQKPNMVVNDSTVTVREEEYSSPSQPNTVSKSKKRRMQAQLKLTDMANEENYYFIKAFQNIYRKGDLVRSRVVELKLSEVLKNNISDSGNIIQDIFGDGGTMDRTDNLFSDIYINGKETLFDFTFDDTLEYATYVNGVKVENDREEEGTVEYLIEIGEISKDMYQYVISGNKAENEKDDPFTEPVQVHSNVENGIGILGSYTTYNFISRFHTKNLRFYLPYEGSGM